MPSDFLDEIVEIGRNERRPLTKPDPYHAGVTLKIVQRGFLKEIPSHGVTFFLATGEYFRARPVRRAIAFGQLRSLGRRFKIRRKWTFGRIFAAPQRLSSPLSLG